MNNEIGKTNYIIDYINENEYHKKERAIKKYNMLAYKKLIFEYYQSFREGTFNGVIVSKNTTEGIIEYELKWWRIIVVELII